YVVLCGKAVQDIVRRGVEGAGHGLEPAVAVEIGHDRAARAPRGRLAPDALFQVNAADWWLDAQDVGPVAERAVAVVHHQLVGPVVVGIAHPRRDEHVLVAVIVEVARGRPPRPARLEARRDRRLPDLPVPEMTV